MFDQCCVIHGEDKRGGVVFNKQCEDRTLFAKIQEYFADTIVKYSPLTPDTKMQGRLSSRYNGSHVLKATIRE
ncbi:MAG: hypothetical protein SCALA701_18960 [Candidatus Scalindua sp.]|nr:MAG: hypothetical protein SCALA701_18960 [Candidatus Scalindua sp.]